jgi:hypothetical protein
MGASTIFERVDSMATLKISLDDATIDTYHKASRHERALAKRVFSSFIRRDTGELKQILEENSNSDEDSIVTKALLFMNNNKGFGLGYEAQCMTREDMNARR